MTEPRLAASVQVTAFIRLAEAEGDQATILRKGDPTSGAILLVTLIKGQDAALFERFPSLDGGSNWQKLDGQASENEQKITENWQKRASRDPDLWVIELNVASQQRLTSLFTSMS